MIIEDFPGSLDERMEKLENRLCETASLIIVGSSYGAVMAVLFACKNPEKVKKLVLLAPALTLHDFSPYPAHMSRVPVTVYHGRYDEVIPLDPIRRTARRLFRNLSFHVLDDDHRLSNYFSRLDWLDLLEIPSPPHGGVLSASTT